MKSIKSEYLLTLRDVFEDDKYFYLVVDLFFGGGLDNVLEKHKYLAISDIRKIMKSLLEGVAELNKIGVMHRDIKPANLLLKNENDFNEVVLCDFGLATKID